MRHRRTEGDETWARLREWTKNQKASERLCAHILRVEGYSSIDPSHPLGGRDALKDIICVRNDLRWIGAAYFPRGQKRINEIVGKFEGDLAGVNAKGVNGFAFVTNQELRLAERKQLEKKARNVDVDLFHLERIVGILDSPACYGIRLEFLDIEMTKEEQLAFIAFRDKIIENLESKLERILTHLESSGVLNKVPLKKIKDFKRVLDSIAGYDPYSSLLGGSLFKHAGHITDLQVPLHDLEEFERILNRIVRVTGSLENIFSFSSHSRPAVQDLQVPLHEIREYETTLNRVIDRLKEAKRLQDELKEKGSRPTLRLTT